MPDNVIGKYRLLVEIGKGGMADVFLAVAQGPIGFNKLLVIKRLKADLADDPDLVAMQLDEARLAARLNHPNVVQTIEVAEDKGQYFIAMEYLEGQPLNRLLNRSMRKKRMPLGIRLRIVCDVLAGLHYAHELADFDGTPLHVVHRDATPQNIFVTYDGQVKLVDFGIAKASKRETETRVGVIKGKVPYMGPQQAEGLPVDRRADIFSIGVLFWELLAETRMWKTNVEEITIIHRLTHGKLPSLRDAKPDVDPELERIVERALSYDIEKRYPTALDFEHDIEDYIERTGERASARDVGTFVVELFADRRAEMMRIIDRQLMELSASPYNNHRPPQISLEPARLSDAPSGDPAMPNSDSFHLAVSVSSERDPNLASVRESPPYIDATGVPVTGSSTVSGSTLRKRAESADGGTRPRRRRLFSLVALGIVALAVGGWVALHGRAPVNSRTDAAPGLSETAPAAPAPAPPVEKIVVSLKANVPGATFSIDNGPPLDNPFIGQFPKDGSQHQVRVEASGYKTKTAALFFLRDSWLDLSLERESPVVQQKKGVPVQQPPPLTNQSGPKPKHRIDTYDPWAQ